MKENEIRAKYKARKCENKNEFQRIMHEMNNEQTMLNHPFVDREMNIMSEKLRINAQIQELQCKIAALNLELQEAVREKKQINRLFHELKHALICANPLKPENDVRI